jgi:hypothetical protein
MLRPSRQASNTFEPRFHRGAAKIAEEDFSSAPIPPFGGTIEAENQSPWEPIAGFAIWLSISFYRCQIILQKIKERLQKVYPPALIGLKLSLTGSTQIHWA